MKIERKIFPGHIIEYPYPLFYDEKDKALFYDENYYMEKESFNPNLASLFKENPNEFDQEVSKISKKSFNQLFVNTNNNSSMKFFEYNKYHQLILDKILKQNKEVNTYDIIEDFKNWFMNNFMEIIQKKEDK
jgi:hypothetical protein